MANWLSKYEQGGLVLKKKTKDNFSLKGNANDSKVSVGPGFVGAGYDTTGRHYSPAWGGQFDNGGYMQKAKSFPVINDVQKINEYGLKVPDWEAMAKQAKKIGAKQVRTKSGATIIFDDNWEVTGGTDPDPELKELQMGGSIPGAVGFMYARTQNPAPSNGKYAKKTQASAQNGQEMKFYQDGLDFKPKSISQNGDWLKKYATEPMRQDATTNVVPRKMTAKEKKEAETAGNVARKRSAEKAKEIVEERMKNRSSKGDLNTPGSWHTEDKARLFPSSVGGVGEMIDDYINPGTYIGVLADALGESVTARDPKAIATSLALAAGTGAIGVDPLGSTIKGVKSAKNLVKQSYKINPLAEKLVNPNMAYRIADEASYQDFLRSGVVRPKSLTPEFQNKTFTDLKELIADRTTSFPSFAKGEPAWGYLPKEGKGYIYATEQPVIRRGDINPVTGKQVGGRHWAYRPIDEKTGKVITELPSDKVKVYGSEPHWLKGYQEVPNIHSEEITRGPINWWEEPGFAKRNPNYNPNIPPPNPFPKQTASDVPQEMMPYLTPKNPDPSIYQRKYAEGGIVDPMGQWAHPGEVTIIPSNDITMEGVNYPVLGISDTGDTQMMYPDQDYKFDGEKVTEYPMAQNGIITNDPKDPRIKAYQDSLNLYNKNKRIYESGIETKARGLKYENAIKGKPYGERQYLQEGTAFDIVKKPKQPVKYQEAPKPIAKTIKGTKKFFINEDEVSEDVFNKIAPVKHKDGGWLNKYK